MKPRPPTVQDPIANLLLYGEPGVGKTLFAGKAGAHPKLGPVLVLSAEGGTSTLAGLPGVFEVELQKDENGNLLNKSPLDDAEDYFWKLVKREDGFDQFKTVILDSGSELQNRELDWIVQEAIRKGKRKDSESRDEIYQEDYGVCTNRMRRLLRLFRDAPFHFVCTALLKEEYSRTKSKNETPRLLSVGPLFTAKLAESARGYVDFVWYLYADGKGTRQLLTGNRGVTKAKTRHPGFAEAIGQRVENPDFGQLYDTYCEVLSTEEKTK